ncbi:MAG: prepilin-type N-terminal cleavage/methylation domain-containing protein [Candidatus Omnitrophica bacterium]|nr:prepilin-type N-terminal cleavage/methylation domain-containing protein [Candidatus Omnitrophota bacterium]MDD5662065.1 prepilin-type N-terminal cleavage/methylation domain-containing protein [Candidatus Omnitrophota bacterium]
MKIKGFALVEIMIVAAIIALLAAIAIPNILSAQMTANTQAAKENIRNLSAACERYAVVNNGAYPATVAQLTAFIGTAGSYCADASGAVTISRGYQYRCNLASQGYTLAADPVKSGVTGTLAYTASTGGVFTPL